MSPAVQLELLEGRDSIFVSSQSIAVLATGFVSNKYSLNEQRKEVSSMEVLAE